MIRYFSVLIFFLCSCLPMWGQEPQWHEPSFININLGGSLRFDTQIDNIGNTYVIALFEDEVTILDTTLYSSKDDGVFLAKFDKNHNLLWAQLLVEAKEATPNFTRVLGRVSLKIDEVTNNIYPSIGYGDSILIENQLFTVDQSQEYYQDGVIFKMTDDGQTEDMYHIKGNCESYIGDVEVTSGYLYFHLSNIRHSLDSDPTCSCIINSDTTINSPNDEAIIGRINQTSNSIDWVKTYNAGGSEVTPYKISLLDNHLFISGKVFSSADLVIDEDSMIVPDIHSRYGYISRFDTEGNHKWSQYYAVNGWDSHITPRDLVFNSDNDVVIVADVTSQSVHNRVYFENAPTLSGLGNDHNFAVMNYDSLGNVKWHDISQSIGNEGIRSIAVDNDKNIYMTGTYNEQITFGSTVLESNMFSNDIIVLSYDSAGNKRWAQKAGGNGSDVGSVIHVDSDGDLRIAGSVTGSSATFGAYQTTPPTPGNSIFITQMKVEPIGLFETTPQQFGVSVYPNPSIGTTNIEVVDEFISQIKVYNGFGQEIKNLNFDNQTDNVSVENLASGYYILDIFVESGKHVAQKLIVK